MNMDIFSDKFYMGEALKEARKAYEKDEVPVGAVVVAGNRIIARAHNQVESLKDATAHTEILAITAASNFLGSKYLTGCAIFISLEPCLMCASALFWSKIGRVVYAAQDEKSGFMRFGKKVLHPKTVLEYGLLEKESKALLKSFFAEKRKAVRSK